MVCMCMIRRWRQQHSWLSAHCCSGLRCALGVDLLAFCLSAAQKHKHALTHNGQCNATIMSANVMCNRSFLVCRSLNVAKRLKPYAGLASVRRKALFMRPARFELQHAYKGCTYAGPWWTKWPNCTCRHCRRCGRRTSAVRWGML